MQLYLIRHGIAAEASAGANDADRPLTEQGQQRTRAVAQRLAGTGLACDRILTSPLVRARQTAEILQAAELSDRVEPCQPLAPGGELADWTDWWQQWLREAQTPYLVLVGHQPDLGAWAETLVWGGDRQKLAVKKAGTIGIQLPSNGAPIGQGELFLLAPPKWLLA